MTVAYTYIHIGGHTHMDMGTSYPDWLSNRLNGDHSEVPVSKEAFEPNTQNSVLYLSLTKMMCGEFHWKQHKKM